MDKTTKNTLEANAFTAGVADFVFSDKRNNKTLNREGLEVGNKLTISGKPAVVKEDTIEGKMRQWVSIPLDANSDADEISVSRLVGTAKRNSVFGSQFPNGIPGYVVKFPQREGDALQFIADNLIGKTLVVVAKAENVGPYESTYFLFAEEDKMPVKFD